LKNGAECCTLRDAAVAGENPVFVGDGPHPYERREVFPTLHGSAVILFMALVEFCPAVDPFRVYSTTYFDRLQYAFCRLPRKPTLPVFVVGIIARILKLVVASEAKQSRSIGYAFACAGLLRFARNDGLFALPQLYYWQS